MRHYKVIIGKTFKISLRGTMVDLIAVVLKLLILSSELSQISSFLLLQT